MLSRFRMGLVLTLVCPAVFATSLQARIEQAMLTELEQSGTPSLQVAVAREGKVLYSGVAGLADVENQVPASTLSRYRSASVSKWFTATAVMRLVEQKVLTLDASVYELCPAFPDKGQALSVRQLLNHTSGIRHGFNQDAYIAAADTEVLKLRRQLKVAQNQATQYRPTSDIAQSLRLFDEDPLVFVPGTDWQYSSHAYTVLGCILESVGAKPYNRLMSELVFDPAGMTSTTADDASALIAGRVRGYRVRQGQLAHNAELRDVSNITPGGGHLTTAEDMVRFAQAFADGRLLSQSSQQLMTAAQSKHVPRETHWRDAVPDKDRYGLGVMVFPTPSGIWFGHTGRIAGGSAIVMHHPQHNLSIAVLTNAKGWSGYMRFTQVLATLLLDTKADV